MIRIKKLPKWKESKTEDKLLLIYLNISVSLTLIFSMFLMIMILLIFIANLLTGLKSIFMISSMEIVFIFSVLICIFFSNFTIEKT